MKPHHLFIVLVLCWLQPQAAAQAIRSEFHPPHKSPVGSNCLHRERMYVQMPMELEQGIIFVEATIDGQKGTFILDTGSPALLLNDKIIRRGAKKMLSVASDYPVQAVRIGHFTWAGIQKQGLEALVMDLSHLEKTHKREIVGVIGYPAFSDYSILIDTQNERILIAKSKSDPFEHYARPQYALAFTLRQHLPVLQVRIGQRSYTFGFDSGSSANFIDQSLLEALPADHYRLSGEQEVYGFSSEPQQLPLVHIPAFSLEGPYLPEAAFLVADFSRFAESGLQVDGLLGFPFIEGKIVSLDYREKELIFWVRTPFCTASSLH